MSDEANDRGGGARKPYQPSHSGIQSDDGDPQTQEDLRAAKEYAEMVVDAVREGLLVLGTDLRVRSANQSFYETFEVSPEETTGRKVYELGNGQWDIPRLRELLEELLPKDEVLNGYEVEHEFEAIGRRVMLLNARQMNRHKLILLAIEDVTEERRVLEDRGRLLRQLTLAEQKERRRIAQLLHDDLQQRLYAIGLKVSFLKRAIGSGGARAGEGEDLVEHLKEVSEGLDAAVEITRGLAVDLSPPVLKEEGFEAALEWLATQMKQRHGLAVEIRGGASLRVPDEDLRVFLFQVARELLFNVVKHAETDRAVVEITKEKPEEEPEENAAERLALRVMDEGRGFDAEEAAAARPGGAGFGLPGLRERLRRFGGTVSIDSAPGEGTRVTVHVALRGEASERRAA